MLKSQIKKERRCGKRRRSTRQKRRAENAFIKWVIIVGTAFDAGMVIGLLIYMYQVWG